MDDNINPPLHFPLSPSLENMLDNIAADIGLDAGSMVDNPTEMHVVIDQTYNQSQGYTKKEVSSLTKAIPDLSAPAETNLTLDVIPSNHILYSSVLSKVFTSPGDVSVWKFGHPAILAGQYIQIGLNYTSPRLVQTPIKICDKPEHQLRNLRGQCILYVDSKGCSLNVEMCQDPRTKKFSLMVYPERGTTSTQIRFSFECRNSCEDSWKQDKQWVLLSHLCSPDGSVLQRCVTDVQVLQRPKAEMIRQEGIVRKRKDGEPGRGRKRINDNPQPHQPKTKQPRDSIGLNQDPGPSTSEQRSELQNVWSNLNDENGKYEGGSREIIIPIAGLSRRQDLENKIIGLVQSNLKTKTEDDLQQMLYNLRKKTL